MIINTCKNYNKLYKFKIITNNKTTNNCLDLLIGVINKY